MRSFTVFPNNIKNVPTDRFLGRDTTGTGQCELLDSAALRQIANIYSKTEVDNLIAGVTGFQPLDSDLTAIAALSTTTFGRALLELADAAAGRSAMGLAGLSTDANGVASLTGTAAAYRAYGPTGVPYTSLSHDGTNGKVQASSGYLLLTSPNGNGIRVADYTSRVDVQSTLPTVHLLSNASVIRLGDPSGSVVYGPITHRVASNCQYGIASDINATSVADIAWARRAAGAWESNNGTAGTLRDVYARTFYGIAQASTDVAVSAQAHASQGSTSPILKVVNSAGSQLVGVLPDALQLGPAVTMKLSFDGPTNVSGANYIQSSYDTFRFRAYGGGGGDWGGNTLSLGSINDDATITNSTRGYGLKLVAIDGYGNANTAGTHITYCAGRGTGNATPGKHKFQTSTRVASGTTFQALSTGIEICDEGIGVYNREVKFYGSGGQSSHGSSMGTYVPHYSDAAVFTLCNGVMENLGPGGTNNSLYRNDIMGTMHFVNRQNVGALGTATLALGPGYFSPSGYLGDYTTPLSRTPGDGALVASSGKGTNIAGSNLKLAGGRPTGTGTPGTVDICTAPSVASGTTLGTYNVVGRFDASITATHTRFLLWDVDAGALKRVYVGAADSGGTGKKVLCVDN